MSAVQAMPLWTEPYAVGGRFLKRPRSTEGFESFGPPGASGAEPRTSGPSAAERRRPPSKTGAACSGTARARAVPMAAGTLSLAARLARSATVGAANGATARGAARVSAPSTGMKADAAGRKGTTDETFWFAGAWSDGAVRESGTGERRSVPAGATMGAAGATATRTGTAPRTRLASAGTDAASREPHSANAKDRGDRRDRLMTPG